VSRRTLQADLWPASVLLIAEMHAGRADVESAHMQMIDKAAIPI
jgi:hypothetical protein